MGLRWRGTGGRLLANRSGRGRRRTGMIYRVRSRRARM